MCFISKADGPMCCALWAVSRIMALGLFLLQTPGLGSIIRPLEAGDSLDSSLASGVPGS